MIIYFVNMIGLNTKGFELQKAKGIIEKLFCIFLNPDYIATFSAGKLSSNFANEILEMTNSAPRFKESVVSQVIKNLTKIGDITEK